MINLHPDVLVIDNTLEGDRRTYARSKYGVPYVRLDAIPHGRFIDEIRVFLALTALSMAGAADGLWFPAGICALGAFSSACLAVRFHYRWKVIREAARAGK
jgi:hypothetical protein